MIPRVAFDDLYRNAAYGFELRSGIIKLGPETSPCVSCRRPTVWAQLNGEYPVCSPVCEDAFSAGFWYAVASFGDGLCLQDHTDPEGRRSIASRKIDAMNEANKAWWYERDGK